MLEQSMVDKQRSGENHMRDDESENVKKRRKTAKDG